MMAIGADRLCSQITSDTRALASLVDGADYAAQVPTCPEWTLRQLTTHVGRAHRWAAEIVATRASQPIPFREVPDGRLPDDPAGRPGWLRAGADRLAGALRAAGDAPVWTHRGEGPAGYWARRMAHETAVHRADAEITLGGRPEIDPAIAADGIDEFLGFVSEPGPGEQASRLASAWRGHSLHIHSTDGEAAGEWMINGEDAGLRVEQGHRKGDVAIRGPASALLLVLTRRLPPEDPSVEILGDRDLLATWLAATQF